MNTPKTVTIYRGSYGNYYEMCGIHYDINFPTDWAKEHHKESTKYGPLNCLNCFYYGHYEGVFVGYCLNCAEYKLNYERGYGLQDEFCSEKELILVDDIAEPLNSMWYKYMNNTCLYKIGDKDLSEKLEQEKNSIMKEDYKNMVCVLHLSNSNTNTNTVARYKEEELNIYKHFLSSSYN